MKNVIVLLGPPSSGKSELSTRIARVLDASVVSWSDVNASSGGDTTSIAPENRPALERNLLQAILRAKNKLVVVTGYGLHAEEAKKMVEWVSQNHIAIDAVARINISLEALVIRAEGSASDESIRDDYYLWRKSAREVDRELAPASKANFELDGDADANSMLADFLANFYMTAKPTNMYKEEASAKLETKYGTFTLSVYQSKVDFSYHLALVKGDVAGKKGVLTRVHSSCITGDILFSKHCDCGEQLQLALETINREGEGVLFYLFQEGRGINIINKIKAYDLQRGGMDTVDANLALGLPAEMRQYEMVREMLDDLGVESIRLLSNNPDKSRKLRKLGVAVESTVNLEAAPNEVNKRYLSAKRDRMGHLLNNIT